MHPNQTQKKKRYTSEERRADLIETLLAQPGVVHPLELEIGLQD